MVRREPRIKTNAAQRGARAVRRERCVGEAGSVDARQPIRSCASSCLPLPRRRSLRWICDARTAPGLTRRSENPVRRRCPPAGAAGVFPATHTISSAELLSWHQV
ncbi:hypothetical protein DB771_07785 [Burkholderia sp. AU29985]|nr:hypothetical protein EGY28_15800 [Burkholderia dolosa]PRE45082.1 hypothetical protein C6P87_22360 [Burkholderia sp. AU12872]PUA77506.1 hypothetical protein DB771_07785 [Burkholderia sp. AU29985]